MNKEKLVVYGVLTVVCVSGVAIGSVLTKCVKDKEIKQLEGLLKKSIKLSTILLKATNNTNTENKILKAKIGEFECL